jgi:hypothetical protein
MSRFSSPQDFPNTKNFLDLLYVPGAGLEEREDWRNEPGDRGYCCPGNAPVDVEQHFLEIGMRLWWNNISLRGTTTFP